MNSLNFIGRLTKDVEITLATNKIVIGKFTLAVNKPNSKDVSFIDCVAFGEIAKNLKKYRKKGDRVGMNGYLDSNVYIDKDGRKRKSISAVAQYISYLDSARGNNFDDEIKQFENNYDVAQ